MTPELVRWGALVILVAAAALDLHSRRIPNWLTLGGASLGIAINLLTGQFAGVVGSLEGWALGLALLFLPFALRGVGGGDLKLLACAGAWVGPTGVLHIGIWSAVVGAGIAVALLLHQRRLGSLLQGVLCRVSLLLAATLVGLWPAGALWLVRQAQAQRNASGTAVASWQKSTFAYGPALALGGVLALLVG